MIYMDANNRLERRFGPVTKAQAEHRQQWVLHRGSGGGIGRGQPRDEGLATLRPRVRPLHPTAQQHRR